MKNHLRQLALIAIVAVLATAFLQASQADYEAAQREQARYCANVASGAWPDFRNDAAEVCPRQ